MFSLKPSAYFRPVWYTLSRMSTVTCKPVRVVAFSINAFTNSTLVKISPRHTRVRCGNSRCSIGLYLEVYGG